MMRRGGQGGRREQILRVKPRRIAQTLSLLALHSSWGIEAKWLCHPVLSCHSCALSWFACPIGVFVHYAGYRVFPVLAFGTVLLLGILLGRLLCGWVCPFGFVQDLLYKIPTPKFRLPRAAAWGKYVVLVLLVVALPFVLGSETWFSFCRICPASALQVVLPAWIAGGFAVPPAANLVRFGVLAGVLALVVLSSRAFCKAICPIGALLGPLNYLSFWRVRTPPETCISCRKCDRACAMDGQPSRRVAAGVPASRDPECILCHDCQSVCPVHGKSPPPANRPGG